MQTSIDRFGRVVIPKTLREHLHLDPGTTLEIEEREDGVMLRLTHTEPEIINEDGVLVFTGTPLVDIKNAVQDHRQHRIKVIGGIDK